MGKFCGNCGAELDQETGLCPHCDAETIKVQKCKKRKHRRVKCIFAVLFVGILLICVLVGLSYFRILHIPGISEWIGRDGVYQIRNVMHYPDGDTVFVSDAEHMQFDENEAVLYYNNVLAAYTFGSMDRAEVKALAESVNGKVVGELSGSVNLVQIQVEESTLQELKEMIAQLEQNEHVICATYEYPMEIAEQRIDDKNPWSADPKNPEKDRQNESNPAGNDWWAEAISAYSAWEYEDQCHPIKVGIWDNGFDVNHEDLQGKLSLLSGYPLKKMSDHGTHVAGVIAARDNKIGTKGIASKADVVCADMNSFGSETEFSLAEYRKVLKQMIDEQVKVINNSWGVQHILSEEKYVQSVYWDDEGYFDSISDTEIFLKKNQGASDWDRRISFVNDNRDAVRFFINHNKVSADTFKDKVKKDYQIRICYDKEQSDKIAEVYWIKDNYSNNQNTGFWPSFSYGYKREGWMDWILGGYDNYMSYVNARAKNTGIDAIALIISALTSDQKDFLIVQAAGNGYDDKGPGFDAKMNGYFCAIDEQLFQSLNQGTRDKLQELGITYQTIKEHIMVVGAVKNTRDALRRYEVTEFSDFGNTVDICAPGQDIFSTVTTHDDNAKKKKSNDGKIYTTMSGTSMAAPMVTGSAAYVWSLNPDLTAAEVKEILCSHTPSSAYGVGEDEGTIYPMVCVGAAAAEAVRRASGETESVNQEPDVPYVTDECCIEYNKNENVNYPVIYHIPRINLQSNAIEELNQKIYNELYPHVENMIATLDDCGGWANPFSGMTYHWVVNGDVLSLIVHFEGSIHSYCRNEWVYSVSISQKEEMTTEQVLERYGLSQEDYQIRLAEAIRKESEAEYNSDAGCLSQSLEKENQEKAKVYIDEKGALRVIVPLFVPADPGEIQVDLVLSEKNVNNEIKRTVNRPEKIWYLYGTEAVGESWETTSSGVENEVVEIEYELLRTGDIQSYAQITGFNEQGQEMWSYTTPQFENAELRRISEIGPRQDGYYFVQDGTVVALDTQTGEKLWENHDFGGSGTGFDFDENAIYLCGAYGPDFYAVSYAGKTLARIESLNSEYSGANHVQRFDDQTIVLFDTGPEGYLDEMKGFYVNLGNIEHLSAKDVSEEPFGKPAPFTEEQLQQIRKNLGVPDDLPVEVVQYEPQFWYTGLTWEIYVSVTLDGKEIAGATIDPRTLEYIRHIWQFNEQNLSS